MFAFRSNKLKTMKIQKIILSICASMLLMVSIAEANSNPKLTWKHQFVSYLSQMGLAQKTDADKIMIDFMLNDNDEIIVLSTNETKLNEVLRLRLNYKKIDGESFETFKKYTLPVVIERR